MKIDENSLQTGDLIGVAGIESDWGAAIMASSKRVPQAIYDHIGLIEKTEKACYVWNANPHDGVARELLADFVDREEVNVPKTFGLYRLNDAGTLDFQAVLAKMRPLLGLPYNFSFLPKNDSYYCSDFVARCLPDGVFPLEAMHFEGDFWRGYYDKLNIAQIPEGQPGINPSDMLGSPRVHYLGDLARK